MGHKVIVSAKKAKALRESVKHAKKRRPRQKRVLKPKEKRAVP